MKALSAFLGVLFVSYGTFVHANPVGGGEGYSNIIDPNVNTVVDLTNYTSINEIITALTNSSPGTIVYIGSKRNNGEHNIIDMSSSTFSNIAEGVTLAGDRGKNGNSGPEFIYPNYPTGILVPSIFNLSNDNVRITGIVLQGPSTHIEAREAVNPHPQINGIQIYGAKNVTIDNNEIHGFDNSGIKLRNGAQAAIHHNYIHHSLRRGYGYGVVLYHENTHADIEYNLFDYNRHAIAGSGHSGMSYVAKYNIVLPHANGHAFDMHGLGETPNVYIAGESVEITNNTFLATSQAIVIRGMPELMSSATNNIIATSVANPISQINNTGNLISAPNVLGVESNYAMGDFDNDSKADVFTTDGSSWKVIYGYGSDWEVVNSSSSLIENLVLGDFNGDGKTDIFKTSSGKWQISESATSTWITYNYSAVTLNNLAFGDFNNDGKKDVLKANGVDWSISYGAQSSWDSINIMSDKFSDNLLIADIDNDGITDVIKPIGSSYKISFGANTSWQDYVSPTIAQGDFDADGHIDNFKSENNLWYVQWKQEGPWVEIGVSGFLQERFLFADINGDKETDILMISGSNWQVSYSGAQRWKVLDDHLRLGRR